MSFRISPGDGAASAYADALLTELRTHLDEHAPGNSQRDVAYRAGAVEGVAAALRLLGVDNVSVLDRELGPDRPVPIGRARSRVRRS